MKHRLFGRIFDSQKNSAIEEEGFAKILNNHVERIVKDKGS